MHAEISHSIYIACKQILDEDLIPYALFSLTEQIFFFSPIILSKFRWQCQFTSRSNDILLSSENPGGKDKNKTIKITANSTIKKVLLKSISPSGLVVNLSNYILLLSQTERSIQTNFILFASGRVSNAPIIIIIVQRYGPKLFEAAS